MCLCNQKLVIPSSLVSRDGPGYGYTSAWKADGSEIGQVMTPDSEQAVRYSVVSSRDSRHQAYLQRRAAAAQAAFERYIREEGKCERTKDRVEEEQTDEELDFQSGRP
jgi:hypothetical protein